VFIGAGFGPGPGGTEEGNLGMIKRAGDLVTTGWHWMQGTRYSIIASALLAGEWHYCFVVP